KTREPARWRVLLLSSGCCSRRAPPATTTALGIAFGIVADATGGDLRPFATGLLTWCGVAWITRCGMAAAVATRCSAAVAAVGNRFRLDARVRFEAWQGGFRQRA